MDKRRKENPMIVKAVGMAATQKKEIRHLSRNRFHRGKWLRLMRNEKDEKDEPTLDITSHMMSKK